MDTCVVLDSPVGKLTLTCGEGCITGLHFGEAPRGERVETALSKAAARQLAEYFAGTRQDFDLPLDPRGTPFQRAVWAALHTIPYGQTRSYADIAAQVGSPKGYRAVGMANHKNPIAIFIPCHRVVGRDGSLTGYAGGLAVKEKLLALEKRK